MPGEIGGGSWLCLFFFDVFLACNRNMARQQNAENRAFAHCRFAEDIAAGLLDDAVNHRQAKAGAFAHFLGGEKRLEDFRFHVIGDAGAVVLNFNTDIFRRNQRRFRNLRAISRREIAGANGDFATVWHRIAGVNHQIDDHLLELIDVSLGKPQITPVFQIKFDALPSQPLEQHLHI